MEKTKSIKKASIIGIISNLFLFIIKALIGFFTNSQAMIMDAFNSFSDIISSAITFIGNRIASRPRDDDHDLGHGKAEYFYSLIISILMFILTFKVASGAVKALFAKETYIYSNWLLVVCAITIILKFILYLYTNKIAKKYDNLLIKANSIDHRNDCFLTIGNMISAIFASFGITTIDSIVSLMIAVWIFISALGIFKNSYNVLMDKAISSELKKRVLDIILSHDEVIKIDHFNSTPIGYQYQISFTIFVDGSLSTFASHNIANSLEKEIARKVPEIFLTVVHVNPYDLPPKEEDAQDVLDIA